MAFRIAPQFLIDDRSGADLLIVVCERFYPAVLKEKPIGLLVMLEAL
jgi:hypothetical protein